METKTTIKIPKQGVDGLVEIIGSTRQSIISARRRLELIIIAAREKQDKTHFLCVPVTDQTVREKFVQFKVICCILAPRHLTFFHNRMSCHLQNQILVNRIIPEIDESMFQNINKLHITFGMLSLMDNEDRILATELFQESREIVERIRYKL